MDLLIFGFLSFFPLFDHLGGQLFASTRVDSIHGNRPFELLELLVNFSALLLLVVELVLKLGSHTIVPILRLLQVETHLVNIGECVEVLVFVEHGVGAFVVIVALV